WDHMQMAVEYQLTGSRAVLEHQGDAMAYHPASSHRCRQSQAGFEHDSPVFGNHVHQIRAITARDEQDMTEIDRPGIEKGDDALILVHKAGRFRPGDNAAEHTGGDISHCL